MPSTPFTGGYTTPISYTPGPSAGTGTGIGAIAPSTPTAPPAQMSPYAPPPLVSTPEAARLNIAEAIYEIPTSEQQMVLYGANEINPTETTTMRKGGSVADARGLAAMGRYGDTMLVHMAPEEVAGLRALAFREGTDLTINPETGLPEANRLKRAFKRFGPMIIGALAAPYLGGLIPGLSGAATAGLLVGGGTMLGGGNFQEGLMKGLGTYGAAQLAQGLGYQGMGGAPGQVAATGSTAPSTGGLQRTDVATSSGAVESGLVNTDVAKPFDALDPNAKSYLAATPPTVPSAAATQTAAAPTSNKILGMSPSTALIGGTMLAGLSEGEKERDMYEEEMRRRREEEERRKRLGMESFERGNQPVNTSTLYGAGGGLVALARGGMTYMEAGGTTGPTGEPRMVAGTGDGMSDSVPATIEGVQEARLANDEFVIPADVVADIGNGSSSAGAKKLYDMMDRIREARHGTTEQPPEIKAEQYMPA